MLSFDFETHPFKTGLVLPRAVCCAFDADHGEELLLVRPDMLYALEQALLDTRELCAHHAAFDFGVLAAERPDLLRAIMDAYDADRVRCTLVRQHLLDISIGEHDFRWVESIGKRMPADRTLAALAKLHLGIIVEKEDTPRLLYGNLDGVPLDQWKPDEVEYPLKDARVLRPIFDAQRERASALRALPELEGTWESDDGEIPDEHPQARAAYALQLFSSWGLRTDPVAVAELRKWYDAELLRVRDALVPTGIMRPDGSRNMKVLQARVKAAYEALGKPVPMTDPSGKFPEGQIKCGADELIATGEWDLELLGEALSELSTTNSWLPHLEMATRFPLCVSYNSLVDSGRTSARKPNIQNPPRKGPIRACFIPRKGYVYIGADYDTAELRALGQVCIWLLGWSDLADALRAGEDPHLSLAADVEGITYEEALERYKAGDKIIKETRQLMKVPNFGLPGGLGIDGLLAYAHGYDPRFRALVDRKRSAELRNAWFKKWREMEHFFDRVEVAVGNHGSGTIQQFWSKRVRGGVSRNPAANSTFQGLVADGAKRAMWLLARECYLGDWTRPPRGPLEEAMHARGEPSPLLGTRVVLFMHDEFIAETPDHPTRAGAAADRLAEVMRVAMQEVIPDVPIKAGATMTRRWHKGAEAVRVDGVLRPSKPVEADGKVKWVVDEGMAA